MSARAQLHITGSRRPRPPARCVAYCDGGIDELWRDGVDVELSHWIPNRTPAAFKASTSTGICLRYAESGPLEAVDLVVNNHVDSDGMLSAFALLHPQAALAQRELLEQAAAAGDFGAWAPPAALHLHQWLAQARQKLQAAGTDPLDIYLAGHALVHRALGGERDADAAAAVASLEAAAARVESGEVARVPVAPRLTAFVLGGEHARAEGWLGRLDEPADASSLLPAAVRSRLDAERAHLVSARAAGGGWFHDLLYPGYCWAETVGLWRPPGLLDGGSSNRHRLADAALDAAARRLGERETAAGRWQVAQTLTPFEALGGRAFPVVLSFMREGAAAASALAPERVAEALAPVFGDTR